MARTYVSDIIEAPIDKVWALARDYNGHGDWHPRIAESHIEDGAPADTAIYRCGHTVACAQCALTMMHRRANCPICRAEIRDVLRVYVGVEPPAEG